MLQPLRSARPVDPPARSLMGVRLLVSAVASQTGIQFPRLPAPRFWHTSSGRQLPNFRVQYSLSMPWEGISD